MLDARATPAGDVELRPDGPPTSRGVVSRVELDCGAWSVHDVHMGNEEAPKEHVRLHINVHRDVMATLRRLAAKHFTSITETVRRAITVLAMVEDIDNEPNQVLAICTLDPKTREVLSMRELKVVG